MKFTQEERAFWTDVLKKTNGDRERLFSMRQVPDEYRAHMDNVTRMKPLQGASPRWVLL